MCDYDNGSKSDLELFRLFIIFYMVVQNWRVQYTEQKRNRYGL